MSSWTNQAKKIAQGKWIRFDAANPAHTLMFVGEPTVVEKTSQQGPTKGEKYNQMSFPVLLDGEEKILEPNKSLLTLLIDEDEEEPILGAELYIKCLDPEKKRSWKIRRIKTGISDNESWKQKKAPAQEEEEEETETEKPAAQDSKDKEKFMAGVKQQRAKRTKKEEKPAKAGDEANDDASTTQTTEG